MHLLYKKPITKIKFYNLVTLYEIEFQQKIERAATPKFSVIKCNRESTLKEVNKINQNLTLLSVQKFLKPKKTRKNHDYQFLTTSIYLEKRNFMFFKETIWNSVGYT